MLKLNGGLVVDNSYYDFFFEINIIIMTIYHFYDASMMQVNTNVNTIL